MHTLVTCKTMTALSDCESSSAADCKQSRHPPAFILDLENCMYLMGPSCACSMVAVTCPVLALMNCTVLSHAAAKVSLSSMTMCFHKDPLDACKHLRVLPELCLACELKAAIQSIKLLRMGIRLLCMGS